MSESNNLKKEKDGYGYKYTELAKINEWIYSHEGWSYTQRIVPKIVCDKIVDYIVTSVTKDGKTEDIQGCRVVQATLQGKSNPAQEQGSALTYARRYSLLMAFGLATEDDDAQSLTRENNKPTLTADRPELQGIHPQKSTKEQLITRLDELMRESAIPESYVRDKFEVEKLESLTKEQIYSTILCWKKVVDGYQKELKELL